MTIRLVGPGGAGKSTVGALLAGLLAAEFIDLDASFIARFGDIGRYIEAFGYRSYAARNVDVYLRHNAQGNGKAQVIALSSGFMTYPDDVHRAYSGCCAEVVNCAGSFVLLPSCDREACVRETVRRQQGRPFARSPDREEEVIRQRFDRYRNLPVTKIETMRSPMDVALDIRSRVLLLDVMERPG